MQRISTRAFALAVGLIIVAVAIYAMPRAAGQTGPGWVSLFDGKTLGSEWDRVGETNWRVEDGAIIADKRRPGRRASGHQGQIQGLPGVRRVLGERRRQQRYLIRCPDPTTITDRSCYEVNIFDQRTDPTYGTGGIVHFVEVHPMPKVGGKWNTYEITAKGRQITVVLNGEKTAELHNGLFAEGPFTLQRGAGMIKFRKVAVKPL